MFSSSFRLHPSAFWATAAAVLVGVIITQLPLPAAAGLVGGAAVLLLVFIQPLCGLALALLAGPWGAYENIILGNTLLDSGQALLLLTLVAWIGRGALRRRLVIPRTPLNWPLLLFILIAGVTVLYTPSLSYSLRELLKWVEMGLVIWMVVDLTILDGDPKSKIQNPKFILAIILLAGLSQALIGVWQFALRGEGPEHFMILGRFFRAYGTFQQPNPYGGYVALNASLALGASLGLLAAGGRGARGQESRGAGEQGGGGARGRLQERAFVLLRSCAPLLLCAVTAAVTSLAVILSWSRGAWLGFGAALAVLVLFWPRRPWLGLALVVVAVALFGLAWQLDLVPAAVSERLVSFSQDLRFGDVRGVDINDANYAVLERLAHWQAALAMIRDHLWTGVGFGAYEPAYPAYALVNWPYPLGHAHNYYFNILAETGIIGGMAYLVFWAAVFGQTLRLLYRLPWPQRGLALGLLAAWTALSVHHLVDKLYVNNVYIHLGAMLGLLQLLGMGENVKRKT